MKIVTTVDEMMSHLPEMMRPVCAVVGEAHFTVIFPRSYEQMGAEARAIADTGGWPVIVEVQHVPEDHQRLIRFLVDQAVNRGEFAAEAADASTEEVKS